MTVGATLAEWVLRPCIFDKPASGDARSWMLSQCEPCETTDTVEPLPTFECHADGPADVRSPSRFKPLSPAVLELGQDAATLEAAWVELQEQDPKQCSTPVAPLQDAAWSERHARPARAVRVVCISDTHSCQLHPEKWPSGQREAMLVPDGDVLIHAGDFTHYGAPAEVASFCEWFGAFPHAHKILICGNHELSLDEAAYPQPVCAERGFPPVSAEDRAALKAMLRSIPRCTYLEGAATEVCGVRFWGGPWQVEYGGWAFQLRRGSDLRTKWKQIPTGTEVVVTHGPPLGHGDAGHGAGRTGCIDLLDELQQRVRPQFCVFGHLHEGYGMTTDGHTTYVNASSVNMHEKPVNSPLVFDVQPRSSRA